MQNIILFQEWFFFTSKMNTLFMYKRFGGFLMNRRYKRYNNTSKTKTLFLFHIENNIKEYLIVSLIFLIGIIVGVIFINNASVSQKEEVTTYISTFLTNLKEDKMINELVLLVDSIKKNIFLAIFLWFMGSTVIGISVVYLTICFRGFCLGYTISSIILCLRNTVKEYFF